MKINENIAKLICKLEYKIGSQCYNPNSYDGWTGADGCEFRYPVHIYPKKGADDPVKIRDEISKSYIYQYYQGEYTEQNIRSMKYKFGSNHLFIGCGLIDVMEFLEERYGIDFNSLEDEYQKKQ